MLGDCDLALKDLDLLLSIKPQHKEALEAAESIRVCASLLSQAEFYTKNHHYNEARQTYDEILKVRGDGTTL